MVTFRRSATSALVLLMLALAIPSAVARGLGEEALPGFAPDRVLVGFRPGTATETARAIEASVGAREIGIVGAGTHLLKVPVGRVLGVVARREVQRALVLRGLRRGAAAGGVQHVGLAGGAVAHGLPVETTSARRRVDTNGANCPFAR